MRLGSLGFATLVAFMFAGAASADPARVKGVIALVPGTINHLAPGSIQVDIPAGELETSPYFSGTILKTLRDLGYSVMVVRDLAALGSRPCVDMDTGLGGDVRVSALIFCPLAEDRFHLGESHSDIDLVVLGLGNLALPASGEH